MKGMQASSRSCTGSTKTSKRLGRMRPARLQHPGAQVQHPRHQPRVEEGVAQQLVQQHVHLLRRLVLPGVRAHEVDVSPARCAAPPTAPCPAAASRPPRTASSGGGWPRGRCAAPCRCTRPSPRARAARTARTPSARPPPAPGPPARGPAAPGWTADSMSGTTLRSGSWDTSGRWLRRERRSINACRGRSSRFGMASPRRPVTVPGGTPHTRPRGPGLRYECWRFPAPPIRPRGRPLSPPGRAGASRKYRSRQDLP